MSPKTNARGVPKKQALRVRTTAVVLGLVLALGGWGLSFDIVMYLGFTFAVLALSALVLTFTEDYSEDNPDPDDV